MKEKPRRSPTETEKQAAFDTGYTTPVSRHGEGPVNPYTDAVLREAWEAGLEAQYADKHGV